jgi:transposase
MSRVVEWEDLRRRLEVPVPVPLRQRVAELLVLLAEENAELREAEQRLRREQAQLRERVGELQAERDRLAEQAERLEQTNARLREQVEALRRAGRRQAAPFSRDDPTSTPKRAGRRPGAAHGRHGHRQPPQQVDQVVRVGLPAGCPGCGGELTLERVAAQHVEELPEPRPLRIRYDIQVGRCRSCGRRVQPRHPEQTSDALGAAAAQLGPRAVALAAWLSKGLGMAAAKIARLFGQLGITVTAGGITQAIARAARAAAPTYQALVQGVRASPVVAPDETGWRVGGRRAWLWAFVGNQVSVYRIASGRGFDDAAVVLGSDYAGVLERDGWAPYRKFTAAAQQSCLAHLLRRCRELVSDAERGQARTPHAVRRILLAALALRQQQAAGRLDPAAVAVEADRLAVRLDRLIAGKTRYAPNRRLLNHLATERAHLFTFLRIPGVQATNWRAEQAIRPAVVTRKSWGGNRTWAGAEVWHVLASVLRTATQQTRDPITLLVALLQAPAPTVASLAIPGADSPTR